jgi:hypothetical protein
MFGRFASTIQLMKASWEVVKNNKRLLILPLLSTISVLLVVASFWLPIISSNMDVLRSDSEAEVNLMYFEPPGENAEPVEQVRFWGAVFAFYFANYFVIIFFNAALVASALFWMRSGESSIGSGLSAAAKRLPQIVGWALVSATVGLLLRVIESASERGGRLATAILGSAWTIMTYLVVPVIVVEGKGPIASLKDSVKMLRETWGQQLAGGFAFGLVYFLLSLVGFGIVAAAVYLANATGNNAVLIAGIAIAAIYLIGLALVSAVMTPVFQAALYVYGKDGQAPGSFGEKLLSGAFRKN